MYNKEVGFDFTDFEAMMLFEVENDVLYNDILTQWMNGVRILGDTDYYGATNVGSYSQFVETT